MPLHQLLSGFSYLLTGFDFSPASVQDTWLVGTFLEVCVFSNPRMPIVGQQVRHPSMVDRASAREALHLHGIHDSRVAVLTQPQGRQLAALHAQHSSIE